MDKNKKTKLSLMSIEDWKTIGMVIIGILLIIFVLINIFWVIYAFVKYGNMPVDQVPAWALAYMFGGRR